MGVKEDKLNNLCSYIIMELNVLVYIAPPFVIENKTMNETGEEITTYSGLLYEIWDSIKHKLVEKKIIKGYNETYVNGIKFNELYNLVKNGTYDICIAYFSVVETRTNVQYTRPLYLNKYAIAYLPDESDYTIIVNGLFDGFLKPVFYAIIIALIIGYILKIIPKQFLSKELRISNSWEIITTLIFRSTLKYKHNPHISNILILTLELFFGIYFIGELTTTLSDVHYKLKNSKIDTKSIINKRILTPKGYANSKHWTNYGAIIEENTNNNILQTYEQNSNEYFGFFDDFELLKLYQSENNKLVISTDNFGFDEIAWMINDKSELHDVLYNINNEIAILQGNQTIMTICGKYFHEDKYLCEL